MVCSNNKPDFICVGPHKTGTGWLYENLNRHKQIHPIDEKEIRYYTKLDFYQHNPRKVYLDRLKRPVLWLTYGRFKLFYKYPFIKGRGGDYKTWWDCLKFEVRFLFWPTSLRWYKSLFEGPEDKLKGDFSPSYATMDERTIRRVKKDFPDVKILFFLREPVERIWSHVKMMLAMKGMAPTEQHINHMLVTRADSPRYEAYPYHSLDRWLRVFGSDQVFVGFYEELISDPIAYYSKICRFLKVEDQSDLAMQLKIAPYRIGHLLRPPEVFSSAEEALNHRYKSSRLDLEIPHELKLSLISKYLEQVIQLDQMIPDSYPAHWLSRYNVTTNGQVATKSSAS